MGINRRCRTLPAKRDPTLCCVICGAELPMYAVEEVLEEREDWRELANKRRRKSVIVPAEELEQTDFVKYPYLWSFWFRAILDDPKTSQMFLSGISNGLSINFRPRPVPRDPQRASLLNLALTENHWNADFHMANLFEPDWNREAGERIAYPIHPHCWLLLDRFVGHDLIMSSLHAFVRAVKGFWKENKRHWAVFLDHVSVDAVCYNKGPHWPTEQGTPDSCPEYPDAIRKWHAPGSPLRIPDIQRLITQNLLSQRDNSGQGQNKIESPVFCLPLDLAVTIVDLMYKTQPHCQQRIDDTRNLLEAFRWRLPNTYWQARCNTPLLFELDDLIKAGTAVNWPGLCLGIEELLLDDDWYCNSGLNNRARTLKLLNGIKEGFLHLLNQGVGQ
ncbi:uncharacterized protein CDV56_107656 [Aspergillus thermomutatus]|uniref:Uncharacterized protein n=1 Tax=Aspergillus thermomutatus TaxID=41047 RepID=A0A397HQK6_ASPTH|nr:uncharacterized protein CDV56_107656 [Aspergillus thermomutatus]RHZ63443.1 hypothetical protein CDV56_107656 [Aspergillus thermomutatus]